MTSATAPRRTLTVRRESWPIRGSFRIARGAKTAAQVVVAEIGQGELVGRGECVPYARYGESVERVAASIVAMTEVIAGGGGRAEINRLMPAGAARNALDCALWDFDAKLSGRPAWQLAGLAAAPTPLVTAVTISLDTPEAMAAAAAALADRPLLKLKLTGDGDLERVRAVRDAAPNARLIVDANESWTIEHLHWFGVEMADLGVELIEQPLPADADGPLIGFPSPVAIGADESCHDAGGVARLANRYQVVNIKLDKTGGLTEALVLKAAAEAAGLGVMVGCMVATSLAMAPAMLVAQGARFTDLDGPLLLDADREPGLRYEGAWVNPPQPPLWG
ncbi:MAG: dipeptide epimerase [Azospirillum sp.]|nr:dipeptide epimerase [Azospirillum sp.]